MDVAAVTLFLALLAVGAQASVVGGAVLRVGAAAGPAMRDLGDRVLAEVRPYAVRLALLVALVATAGSLYLSEVANFPPCRLCWYQRIAVYPLVPILAVAAFRRDGSRVRPFALILPALGLPISIYHSFVERFPSLEGGSCDPNNPCSIIWVERFGYLTIPVMAASAQALIIALLLCVPNEKEPDVEPSARP